MRECIDNYINYISTIRNYSDYTEKNYQIDLDNYEDYIKKHRLNYKTINYDNIIKYNKYLKEELKLSASSLYKKSECFTISALSLINKVFNCSL